MPAIYQHQATFIDMSPNEKSFDGQPNASDSSTGILVEHIGQTGINATRSLSSYITPTSLPMILEFQCLDNAA